MPELDQPPVAGGELSFVASGIASFARSRLQYDIESLDADIAVMGVPTDEGTFVSPGARLGPSTIRESSQRFPLGEGYWDDDASKRYLEYEMQHGRIADVGDAQVLPTNPADTFHGVTAMTAGMLQRGALPVVLGGDHSISFATVRAYTEPVHVLHFDAHIDFMPFVHGMEYTQAHAFRHISAMPHVQGITQVGLRSLSNTFSWLRDARAAGNRLVSMEEFRDLGRYGLVESLPANAKVYVSIDIDVLDLPLVPGCASAEPNGMLYAELRDALTAVAEHVDVVGFDLVEVNPLLDADSNITSFLGAHTVIEFLARICDQQRWRDRRHVERS